MLYSLWDVMRLKIKKTTHKKYREKETKRKEEGEAEIPHKNMQGGWMEEMVHGKRN